MKNEIEESCQTIGLIEISGYTLDEFRTFNHEGFTVLCNLEQTCGSIKYIPQTSTIVLNTHQQNLIVNNFEPLVVGVAKDLKIPKETAIAQVGDFFASNQTVVQPIGFQGKVYKTMRSLQNIAPITYAVEATKYAKLYGITGGQIITQAPLTFVGVTYLGSIFFSYFGSVAGDNTLGSVLNLTSYVFSRPMRCVEITLNGLILRPVSNVIGLPLILNGTQEVLTGKGLTWSESAKIGLALERLANSRVGKKAIKLWKVFREKEE